MRRLLCIAATTLLTAAAFGCSPSPAEPDEPEDELAEAPDAPVTDLSMPQLGPVEMADSEPVVEDVDTVDEVSHFRVGEIDVIHMPTPANEVVAARLYLRGGSAMLDESLAGIEQLALSVATNGGTESTPKDQFNARLDAVGSSVSYTTNRDFSGYSMRSVRGHFDETWELFEEAIFEPAFPESEIELRRDRQIASIQSIIDNPDRLAGEVARDLAFGDHPYMHRQLGTEENVAAFTRDDLRAWHRTLLAPERMVLVVVGDLERDELAERVSRRLGRLKPTGLELPELPGIDPEVPALRVEELDLPTNYILGYFPSPTLGDADYPALVLATQHLRDRLFEEIRTKRNLTYAVSSGLGQRGDNVGFLYVTAVDPEATMPVMFSEIERLTEEELDETTLEKVRNVFLTRHYMDLETNASIAGRLGRAELIGGDWRISQRFVDDVMDVTVDDIRRVAETYLRNYQFGVVGDPELVPASVFGVEASDAVVVDEFQDPDPEDLEEQPEPTPDDTTPAPEPEPTDAPQ